MKNMYIVTMPDASNAMEINKCLVYAQDKQYKLDMTLHRYVPILLVVYVN